MVEVLEGRRLRAAGPDLQGGEFYITNPTMIGASVASVTFMVVNSGTVNADAGPFDVRFYWSASTNFADGDEVAAPLASSDPFYQAGNPNAVHFAALAHSTLAERMVSIVVPSNLPVGTNGTCYLGMRIDEANAVAESSKTNNNSQGTDVDSALAFWQREAARFEMNTSTGWTLQSQWAMGMPQGLAGDPSIGFSGLNVLGYNLGGAYPASMSATQWATSPAISTIGYRNVSLSFRRWLGIESSAFDHATIQASTDGSSWSTIWSNSAAVNESAWSAQTYALPGAFDNQAAVYVRFGMGPTDASGQYCGWNIDDLVIRGLPLISAATGTPTLVTDTGASNTDALVNLDNSSAGTRLTFQVPATVAGATVTIYADGISIGSAVATGPTTNVQTNGSYDLSDGVHQITATQTEAGKTESVPTAALAITVDTVAPTRMSFQVNDGSAQRSMVRSLQVVLSETVVLDNGLLLQKKLGAAVAGVSATVANPSGDQKTYVLTFSGSAVAGLSLPDGAYRLYVSAAGVVDLAGNAMVASVSNRFFRLFGDSNGDRMVDRMDLLAFRAALGQPASNAWCFDYDASGGNIDAADYQQMRRRLLRTPLA